MFSTSIMEVNVAGLRAKQKAHRRDLIEQAASQLFVERSFATTTIEDIAERAVVSPATVYNYYGSKNELLLALVVRGEVGIEERREDFIAQAERQDPAALVTDVIMSNINDTLAMLSRDLWGHMVAYVATTKDTDVAPRYLETISQGLGAAIEEVMARFVALGTLKVSTNPAYMAALLTRIERVHFLNFVYLKQMSLEELHDALLLDVTFVIGPLKA
jgi:AcrR family transcriptional regulator